MLVMAAFTGLERCCKAQFSLALDLATTLTAGLLAVAVVGLVVDDDEAVGAATETISSFMACGRV